LDLLPVEVELQGLDGGDDFRFRVLDEVPDALPELGPQLGDALAVNHMGIMFKIERNVVHLLGQEDVSLAQAQGVTQLKVDVRVLPGHVRDDHVRLPDLVEYPIDDAPLEDLLVHPLAVSAGVLARGLDPELVEVVELGLERHQDEDERFGTGIAHVDWAPSVAPSQLISPAAGRLH
jgi:hypothetical protein